MRWVALYTCRNRACSHFRAEFTASAPCGRCGYVTVLASIHCEHA